MPEGQVKTKYCCLCISVAACMSTNIDVTTPP
jgi:hypothetical protein